MDPVTKNIIISAACVALTVALIARLVEHFKLFKMKAEIQEDLANLYTPDILGAKPAPKKREVKSNGTSKPVVEKDAPYAQTSDETSDH